MMRTRSAGAVGLGRSAAALLLVLGVTLALALAVTMTGRAVLGVAGGREARWRQDRLIDLLLGAEERARRWLQFHGRGDHFLAGDEHRAHGLLVIDEILEWDDQRLRLEVEIFDESAAVPVSVCHHPQVQGQVPEAVRSILGENLGRDAWEWIDPPAGWHAVPNGDDPTRCLAHHVALHSANQVNVNTAALPLLRALVPIAQHAVVDEWLARRRDGQRVRLDQPIASRVPSVTLVDVPVAWGARIRITDATGQHQWYAIFASHRDEILRIQRHASLPPSPF